MLKVVHRKPKTGMTYEEFSERLDLRLTQEELMAKIATKGTVQEREQVVIDNLPKEFK